MSWPSPYDSMLERELNEEKRLVRGMITAKGRARAACAAFLCATLALSMVPCASAFADEMEEDLQSPEQLAQLEALKEEASTIRQSIDSLQTDLNRANDEYNAALAEYNECLQNMRAAQVRYREAEQKKAQLQGQLSDMAINMYKSGGTTSYLEVLLGATTFDSFVSGWDMVSRVSNKNAELIAEARALAEESRSAREEFQSQKARAEERMKASEEQRLQIISKQADLSSEAAKITAEVAGVEAEMELEAEAARAAERAAKEAAQAYAATLKAGDSLDVGDGYFADPCPDSVESSGWGYRAWDNKFHKGTDMAAPMGTPFYAAEAGTVIYTANDSAYNGGAGNYVVISHGNGLVTKYMHASAVFVKPGDVVERGQNIGAVGSTGRSTGPHLHFQVEFNGTAVCPYDFL